MENFNKRELGAAIEEKAAAILEKTGHIIKERNFRAKFGEIDIIAYSPAEKTLVFVEVKAKELSSGIHPFEAVDAKKQRRIILAAREYAALRRVEGCFMRFDVIGVILDGGEIASVEIARDAFQSL
ncbi:MAG: YraN family protein [Candidatus Goldiibacteriota bacterium]|jgi:putative endonuclease